MRIVPWANCGAKHVTPILIGLSSGEAVLSSRIEGTQTSIEDLYVYEAGHLPLFPELSARSGTDVAK